MASQVNKTTKPKSMPLKKSAEKTIVGFDWWQQK
jgi:hypothetical protein